MFLLTIKGEIASAHFLRGYPGKCQNLHGHTWKIELTLEGKGLNDLGMVHDLADLKKKFRSFLEQLDHQKLNELPYFKEVNPTVENIAQVIYEHFSPEIVPLHIQQVQVWESDLASAIYVSDRKLS